MEFLASALELSFTPWQLYPRRKNCRNPLDRRLGGLNSLPGIEARIVGSSACSLVIILTEVPRFSKNVCLLVSIPKAVTTESFEVTNN
jgi:hypothetical protein